VTEKQYAYYPGCSLEGTAKEYDESFRAVCAALELPVVELQDWSCCGASAAHSTNEFLAVALPARNLKLAQEAGRDIVTPCAACWNRLRAAVEKLQSATSLARNVVAEVGVDVEQLPEVVSAHELMLQEVSSEELSSQRQAALENLPVVPYYGCLYVRPIEVTAHPNPEDPQELDTILEWLGADVRAWSYKTDCCGGALTMSRADVVTGIVDGLLQEAAAAGARAVVSACPMCTQNLEMRRSSAAPSIPILYFTELIGIALGLKAKGWLDRHLVSVGTNVKSLLSEERAETGVKQ
jgi:heterodisulfide reductase subunit B